MNKFENVLINYSPTQKRLFRKYYDDNPDIKYHYIDYDYEIIYYYRFINKEINGHRCIKFFEAYFIEPNKAFRLIHNYYCDNSIITEEIANRFIELDPINYKIKDDRLVNNEGDYLIIDAGDEYQ